VKTSYHYHGNKKKKVLLTSHLRTLFKDFKLKNYSNKKLKTSNFDALNV